MKLKQNVISGNLLNTKFTKYFFKVRKERVALNGKTTVGPAFTKDRGEGAPRIYLGFMLISYINNPAHKEGTNEELRF